MGLVHPPGIYAVTDNDDLEFRLAPAMVLQRHGIRQIGGAFKELNIIECDRTKAKFTARIEHKLELPGRRQGDVIEIEESAMYENGQLQTEGLYLDQVVQSDVEQLANHCRDDDERDLTEGIHPKSYPPTPNSKGRRRFSTREI